MAVVGMPAGCVKPALARRAAESDAKPYAEFLRRYGAVAGARMLSLGPGCAMKDGQWQPTGWLGSATSLALAAGVLVLDAVLLVDAVVALVR